MSLNLTIVCCCLHKTRLIHPVLKNRTRTNEMTVPVCLGGTERNQKKKKGKSASRKTQKASRNMPCVFEVRNELICFFKATLQPTIYRRKTRHCCKPRPQVAGPQRPTPLAWLPLKSRMNPQESPHDPSRDVWNIRSSSHPLVAAGDRGATFCGYSFLSWR